MRSTSAVAGSARKRHARLSTRRRALAGGAGIILAVLLGASAGLGAAGQKIGGWGTDGQVTMRFAGGLALWEASKRYVHVGFLPSAPTPEERAGFLNLTRWPDSVKVPAMTLGLTFNAGETTASLSSLHQYYVSFRNYPLNPYNTANIMNYISNRWEGRGDVQDLSGELRKGGHIRGKFAREWLFTRLDNGAQVRYQWNLEFDATLE